VRSQIGAGNEHLVAVTKPQIRGGVAR
jgi:hypothetical protein